jgi:hypothetical protein
MDSDQFKTFKLVVIVALIIGVIGAIFYLVYGFTIIWQGMAAGVIIGFLSILVILLIGLSIYLWVKILLMKRELKKCRTQLENAYKKIRSLNNEMNIKNKEVE